MEWEDYISNKELIASLRSNSMTSPTEIQKASLLNSCNYRQDLIISSKTGSGKTLCFAIPLLLHIQKNSNLQALIISPTRELCLQINSHISQINYKSLTIVTLIGGISHEKQERYLKRKPEIIIGTPGRLWEYISDKQNDYVRSIHSISFLVIDEADRMIQMGHFKELRFLLKYIDIPSMVPREIAVTQNNGGIVDLNFGYEPETPQKTEIKRQTFVISATMTIGKSERKSFTGKLGKHQDQGEDILKKLEEIIKFRNKPKLIDLTGTSKLPESLEEFTVFCNDEEKSSLLHYILSLFSAKKTIVFTNKITVSRKIAGFLRNLDYKVSKLDGKMSQGQRLDKLEK